MLDSYTSENHQDFNARYADTYGWLLSDDHKDKRFVHLIEADGDKLMFDMGTSMVYNTLINSGKSFQFIQVTRGWFYNIAGEVFYLSRMPARQWKRGISGQNTRVQPLRTMRGVGINYDTLASIFMANQDPRQWKYGKEFVISKHFAIGMYGDAYFYNQEIGVVDKEGTITLNAHSNVRQELMDAIKRGNINLTVKE